MRGLAALIMTIVVGIFALLVSKAEPKQHEYIIIKTIHHDYDKHNELTAYIRTHPNYRLTNTITSCYGGGSNASGGECTTTLVFESR